MTIRAALLVGAIWLIGASVFAQHHRLGAEAEGAKDGHAHQVQVRQADPVTRAGQAFASFAPDAFQPEVIRPSPPQPQNLWEDILPVCLILAAIWLTFLILGLTLTNSIAAGVFLLLMAWTAPIGVGALLLVILALAQLSTRSERVARRAHDPMWRMKRWRSR